MSGMFGWIKGVAGKEPTETLHRVVRSRTIDVLAGGTLEPEMLRLVTPTAQLMEVPRQKYRKEILPTSLRSAWNSPDDLAALIHAALIDRMTTDVMAAGERLHKTDPDRHRATALWSLLLLEHDRLDEAEAVLKAHLAAHPDDATAITLMGEAHVHRENRQLAQEHMWRAAELDPNHLPAVEWVVQLAGKWQGPVAAENALKRMLRMPGSWGAHLNLARQELDRGETKRAMTVYRHALKQAGDPPPRKLLAEMGEELVAHGKFAEVVELLEPLVNPATHGLLATLQLMAGYFKLKRLDDAEALIERLAAEARLEWAPVLANWREYLARRRELAALPGGGEEAGFTVTLEGAVWMSGPSPARTLFVPPAPPDPALRLCFLGSSVEVAAHVNYPLARQGSLSEMLSRAIPLLLSEQTMLMTGLETRVSLPFLLHPQPGFLTMREEPLGELVARLAQEKDNRADVLVATHLIVSGKVWRIRVRFIRAGDGACLDKWGQDLVPTEPHEAMRTLVSRTMALLLERALVPSQRLPAAHDLTAGKSLAKYMNVLAQLAAVRVAADERVPRDWLQDSEALLVQAMELCRTYPQSVLARVLLMDMATAMRRVRPETVRAAAEHIRLLQVEHPLAGPSQTLVGDVLGKVLG